MSYSRRQLYAMGEPLGDGSTRREVGGKIIYGGGGGGTPEKQTTVVDIPDWAKPYAKESLGKASALSNVPYQTYGGERIAQFTPMQKQAFGRAEGQQVASQIGAGSGLAGTAGLMGLTGGYQPGQFGSQMSQYMSPYMEAVTQRQMDSAQRQADIASTQRGAQAVRAGAFGGSRQAIESAEAARALASQKGQIQEQGLQSAYDRATDMYGREQALAEQSRQAGLGTALTAAGQLGQLGGQQFGQEMGITGQQAQFGGQQRQATQDILSQQYQDFLNQQRAPYDQLAFMSSMIRGTPMGQTTTQYQPPPSTTSQLIGLGTAAAGAYGAYKGAAGGSVPSYASGGKLNLEGTFEVADGGGGLGSLGGRSMFDNMQQGGIGGAPSLAVMPRDNSRPMDMMMRPAVMPQGGVYAAGGIASLNQPELSAMAGGMSDEQLAQAGQSSVNPELAKMTLAAEAQQRAQLREQSKAMQAKGSMSNITSTLANMPDEQLQQYAKLNKGDPYIMALVVAEANRRKEGGMPTQEAPTVVDQQIAGMALPEDMGIAQLPAGNMEFAGGGIIAFAEGDLVPDPYDNRLRRGPFVAGVTDQPPAVATPSAILPPSAVEEKPPALPAGPNYSGIIGLYGQERDRQMAAQEELGRLRAADLAADRAALAEEEKRATEFGAEREKRLKGQEEKLAGSEKQNLNMTLIDMGLAMMAGRSPDALQNLAAGAQQGLKGYQGRLQNIQDSREKLDESMARLAEIREEKLSAVGARKRELESLERKEMTSSKEAQEKIYSSFADKKITLTKDQAKEASDRSLAVWTAQQKGVAGSRTDAANLRLALSGEIKALRNQRDNGPGLNEAEAQQLAQLEGEFRSLTNILGNRLGVQGSGTVGGSSTLPAGFKLD